MEKYNALKVMNDGMLVGTLATYKTNYLAFEYSDYWINNGYSISPFSLPLEKRVYIPKIDPFDGVFGVFWDSMPDGWGRLLVDRMLQKNGINPSSVDNLTRLAIVGDSGMGALSYVPSYPLASGLASNDLDFLSKEANKILEEKECKNLDDLFIYGGSSGGARPKAMLEIDSDSYIVKFPSRLDPNNVGVMEYEYASCAEKCGIELSPYSLLPSKVCSGFFASKRFDRVNGKRIHMISVSALLEVSHRIPSLDYNTLMALTLKLTKDYGEVEKMFRLMCFNVFAHNRDDHSNNFSFIFEDGKWRLSPAYDLTYSNSIGGEHATSINGNGKDPGLADILCVAEKAGLKAGTSRAIAEEIQYIVNDNLKKYV